MTPDVVLVNSDRPYDTKVDIWSLGVCILKLLTGKAAWSRIRDDEIMLRLRKGEKPYGFERMRKKAEFGWEAVDFLEQCFAKNSAVTSSDKTKCDVKKDGMDVSTWVDNMDQEDILDDETFILQQGFKVPTPIQRKTIPLIMEENDVVGYYGSRPEVIDPVATKPSVRLAIIESGPAGFYTAYRVMKDYPSALID
ncbi:8262_t:CDS:2, partial [Paraglomus occultum]